MANWAPHNWALDSWALEPNCPLFGGIELGPGAQLSCSADFIEANLVSDVIYDYDDHDDCNDHKDHDDYDDNDDQDDHDYNDDNDNHNDHESHYHDDQ